jgi:GNAT superfamily N-acetyltransferase
MLENAEAIGAAWLAAEINGQLVGCGLLLPDGGALTLALLGLDYTAQYAYFQLMYAAIRHAIQAGASVLRGGTGAYEFKQRLGFQTEPRSSIAFYITNGVLRRVAGWV